MSEFELKIEAQPLFVVSISEGIEAETVAMPFSLDIDTTDITVFTITIGETGSESGLGLPGATGPMGPAGPPGADGAVGATGVQGPAGTNGTNGINGTNGATGAQGPTGVIGARGPQGLTGLQGPQGIQGPAGDDGVIGPIGPTGSSGVNGTDGNAWSSGTSFPVDGNDNDFYLRTSTYDVYKRITGVWSVVANIQGPIGNTGPAGNNGSVWTSGSTVPTGGSNNDFYFRTTNGDVYKKLFEVWTVITNIKGATGATGSTGLTGATGATGAIGATGPQGIQGIQGLTGTNDEVLLEEIVSTLVEYSSVAKEFVEPKRRFMPIGDSYILASDDNRKAIHLCLSDGSYRINCSGIALGCYYTIAAASADSIRIVLECGPGLTFIGMNDGTFATNSSAIEIQSGESITIVKGLTGSIFVASLHRNLDIYSTSTGSPSVDVLFVQQPENGKYTIYMTRTIATNGDITSTPSRPGRILDFLGALTTGSVVVDGATGSVLPFKVDVHVAGTTINIVNPNAFSVRGTVSIRDVNWSYS